MLEFLRPSERLASRPPVTPFPVEPALARELPPSAPGLTGLRRLASLAERTAAGERAALVPEPQRPEDPTAGPSFADRMGEILRAEAERHGIDVEGAIR